MRPLATSYLGRHRGSVKSAAVAAPLGSVLVAAGLLASAPSAHADTTPLGHTVRTDGTSVSGALFPSGLGNKHVCSGTVTTVGGDSVVVAAAHCITGRATGWLFAPKYNNGSTPYGVFAVQGVYVDPRWNGGRNSRYDVAVLRVAKMRWKGTFRNIGQITGTTVLRAAPPAQGRVVDITGYKVDLGDKPLSCSNTFGSRDGWGFTSCDYLPIGVSGSGMRYGSDGRGHQYLAGLIGGFHFGGCYGNQAYTPAFGPWVTNLVVRARDGRPSDTLPTNSPWDGCHGTRP